MKRRKFLSWAAAGAVAVTLPAATWTSAMPEDVRLLAEPFLLDVLRDREAILRIGEEYRRMHPDEDYAGLLARGGGHGAPRSVRSDLEQTVRADFADGRTVQLDGWILARTEARQCALYALMMT